MIQATKSSIQTRARTNTACLSAPHVNFAGAALAAPAANLQMPTAERNYCIFDEKKVNYYVSQKERALPYLKKILQTSQDEKEIIEALYILDRMIDEGTKGIPAMYPILAKFNNTESPNIQSFLAGIYRKIQVPDAFGPLVAMLIRNSISTWAKEHHPKLPRKIENSKGINEETIPSPLTSHCSFIDPNEEIGGAILAYIENYSNSPKKIDYIA